jgi:hypothetical protein
LGTDGIVVLFELDNKQGLIIPSLLDFIPFCYRYCIPFLDSILFSAILLYIPIYSILFHQHAADCYAGEENKSSANKCLIKIANYSALTDHLDKAIKLYEQLGEISPFT